MPEKEKPPAMRVDVYSIKNASLVPVATNGLRKKRDLPKVKKSNIIEMITRRDRYAECCRRYRKIYYWRII